MSPRPVLTIRSPCEAWCKRNYRGRSPDSQVVAIRPTFPLPKEQWLLLAGSLAAHSGATARDSHPLPFSLAAHGEHLGIAPIEPYLGVRRQIDRLAMSRETGSEAELFRQFRSRSASQRRNAHRRGLVDVRVVEFPESEPDCFLPPSRARVRGR
jgi:hypothetical protein